MMVKQVFRLDQRPLLIVESWPNFLINLLFNIHPEDNQCDTAYKVDYREQENGFGGEKTSDFEQQE